MNKNLKKLNDMLKGRKKIVMAVIAVVICGAFGLLIYQNTRFPVKECVETILDVMYKGNIYQNQDFESVTVQNKEEAQQLYNQAMENRKNTLKQYFGITQLSEEGEEVLEEFAENLYKNYISYEIDSCKEKDEDYIITLEVRPVAFYELIDKEKFMENFRLKTEDGEYDLLMPEEYETVYLKALIGEYQKALEKKTGYLKKREIQLTLQQSGDIYLPSQEDFQKVEKALIAFSK